MSSLAAVFLYVEVHVQSSACFRESESVGDWMSEWGKLWSVGLDNAVKEEDGGEDTRTRDG